MRHSGWPGWLCSGWFCIIGLHRRLVLLLQCPWLLLSWSSGSSAIEAGVGGVLAAAGSGASGLGAVGAVVALALARTAIALALASSGVGRSGDPGGSFSSVVGVQSGASGLPGAVTVAAGLPVASSDPVMVSVMPVAMWVVVLMLRSGDREVTIAAERFLVMLVLIICMR